jgi:DNA-binding Lrp family transcriptional regulator
MTSGALEFQAMETPSAFSFPAVRRNIGARVETGSDALPAGPGELSRDQRLLAAIQEGLPLVSRPYAEIGQRVGMSETEVIERLGRWIEAGVIKRLGVVVRHRKLGYRANAMVVFDVPDERVGDIGQRLAAFACVTLCYRRPRRGEDWPYNLFCMIHGRDRTTVEAQVEALAAACGLAGMPRAVLFSRRCFKQRGAVYRPSGEWRVASGEWRVASGEWRRSCV